MDFSKVILKWYEVNKREFPWRKTKDPYRIWLSEIILQQTQISQGLPYYERFVKTFPTIQDLAEASEEKVLKLWQGLGYYSRARNLHFTAKYIHSELEGVFPNHYKSLLKLKGVGDYTASAIASIVYGECTPVVDGNVYRVLSRFFGVSTPINSTQGIKEFKLLATKLIDCSQPATYNQAIMDFGARQCRPKNPDCETCPLNSACFALSKNEIHLLPAKLKKTKIKKKYFNFIVVFDTSNKILFEQRTENGIWKNLYQFPLVETDQPSEIKQMSHLIETKKIIEKNEFDLSLYNQEDIIHKLTHIHIHSKFWICQVKIELTGALSFNELEKKPMPILLKKFIDNSNLFQSE